ncbi:MAG TPA: hypothetical protein DCM87_02460 [Planctomycetes bacterium]|nr:hypothetical protein [Planctomycetota bacterium]
MPGREAGKDYPRQFKGNAMAALFRHRRTFVDFVDAFIDLRGARGALRFDRAEMLPQGFVTEKLRAGARDVLWQVPVEDCGTFAVFLIEHQSAVDFSMPMRMQLYKHRIWQDQRAAVSARIRCAEGFRWPLVIPIVFYTGAAPWSGPVRLADILAHGGDFEELSAAMEFLLVDVGCLSDTQVMAPGNFARAIVRLIRAMSFRDTEAEFFAAFDALRGRATITFRFGPLDYVRFGRDD